MKAAAIQIAVHGSGVARALLEDLTFLSVGAREGAGCGLARAKRALRTALEVLALPIAISIKRAVGGELQARHADDVTVLELNLEGAGHALLAQVELTNGVLHHTVIKSGVATHHHHIGGCLGLDIRTARGDGGGVALGLDISTHGGYVVEGGRVHHFSLHVCTHGWWVHFGHNDVTSRGRRGDILDVSAHRRAIWSVTTILSCHSS